MDLVVGWTPEGELLVAEVEVSHDRLDAPEITSPAEDDVDVAIDDLTTTWLAVEGAEGYRIEIEDEETEIALEAEVPGDATSFTFPADWLQPGVKYTLDVRAFGEDGNVTVSDIQFTTME